MSEKTQLTKGIDTNPLETIIPKDSYSFSESTPLSSPLTQRKIYISDDENDNDSDTESFFSACDDFNSFLPSHEESGNTPEKETQDAKSGNTTITPEELASGNTTITPDDQNLSINLDHTKDETSDLTHLPTSPLISLIAFIIHIPIRLFMFIVHLSNTSLHWALRIDTKIAHCKISKHFELTPPVQRKTHHPDNFLIRSSIPMAVNQPRDHLA